MNNPLHAQPFQKWSALHPQLLWAYEGAVAPDALHHFGVRHPDSLNAWLIQKGKVRLTSGSATLHAKRNEWIFFSGQFIKQDFSPAARILSLSFRIHGTEMPHHTPVILPITKYPELERAALKLTGFLEKILPGVRTDLAEQSLTQSKFAQVFSRFAHWLEEYYKIRADTGISLTPQQHVDGRLARVLERLTFQSLVQSASTSSLAQSVGLTAGHLDRLFVREFGATPRRMRENRRREEALQRVAHSDTPFKQLAYELGFSNPAHFSNWFHRSFQTSPKAYRQQHSS